jgi:hypothetical protein
MDSIMRKPDIDPLVLDELERLGAILKRDKGHYVYFIKGFGNIVISHSPSCWRATLENLRLLRKAKRILNQGAAR